MKHIMATLALPLLAAQTASATPRYFGDPAMVIRPTHLMQNMAQAPDGQPRLMRVSHSAGVEVLPAPVPEPGSAVLLPLGSAAVLWARRRHRDKAGKAPSGKRPAISG